jgi:large subunit ribosomal protein L14e
MSAESKVVSTNWRLVQVGRVVLFQNKLAAIVEIIDQKRVRIN